jgi:hypothetical protein
MTWQQAPIGMGRARERRIALVASRDVVIGGLYWHLVEHLKLVRPETTVLLRSPRNGPPMLFEATIARVADAIGLKVAWFTPEGSGREATFHRDYRMVESADQVIAYFDASRIMEGGTGHVVEAALVREIPVSAWSVTENGVTRVGEIELSDVGRN